MHKPFLRHREGQTGRSKGYLPRWKLDSIKPISYTHAVKGRQWCPREYPRFRTILCPPTANYRLSHRAVKEHEGLEQHSSCYQASNSRNEPEGLCRATKPEGEGEMVIFRVESTIYTTSAWFWSDHVSTLIIGRRWVKH